MSTHNSSVWMQGWCPNSWRLIRCAHANALWSASKAVPHWGRLIFPINQSLRVMKYNCLLSRLKRNDSVIEWRHKNFCCRQLERFCDSFSDTCTVVSFIDFLKKRVTVTAHYYSAFLKSAVWDAILRKRPGKLPGCILHDKTLPHATHFRKSTLSDMPCEVLPHCFIVRI